jgi:membrane protease YdiL (CAAX protease family)
MEANLPAPASGPSLPERTFPYSNWGPWPAVAGVLLAIVGVGILSVPIALIDDPAKGEDLSTLASVILQLCTAASFLLVPFAIAATQGADLRQAIERLGIRRFPWKDIGWMAAAILAYLIFAALYVSIVGEPEQEDIAEGFGAIPVQVFLIVIAAPISEEVCFRGMLFGGLRERLNKWWAAAIAGAVFGLLHALTGLSAVPPLMMFGFILCLLYEETGSIVPGILLHMLNNSVALLSQ